MRRALGKGLSQLIAEQFESAPTDAEVGSITPNSRQPRTYFDEDALQELADSIREHGIIQPLLVRPTGEGEYELIAGERRLRAAKLAGLDRVPIVIRSADNQVSLELALIENVQREDINPIESAQAYRKLIDEFSLTQEQVAVRVGKSRTVITNMIRLLRLPIEVQEGLQVGSISEGHARALLQLGDEARQLEVYEDILVKGLTVRDVERVARPAGVPQPPKPNGAPAKRPTEADPNVRAVEDRLREFFGTPVKIQATEKGGTLTIEFFSDDDLQRVLDVIGFQL